MRIARALACLLLISAVGHAAVSVEEVGDYVFGSYKGEFKSPPDADQNPRSAVIVKWDDKPYRFVFWHEASYCPWVELADGSAVCEQFFEGNDGWAELFNEWGRKEENSYVQVRDRGPERVWVHWVYYGVNQQTGQRAYRGDEDFYCYDGGVILRRQTFKTMMPGDHRGYAREPIETIGVCPVGRTWRDVLQSNDKGERHALFAADPFSDKRYDVWWNPKQDTVWASDVRRDGCDWREIDDAPGVMLGIPMKAGTVWCAFGEASGYSVKGTRIKEHSHKDTGGIGWGSTSWDHWPVGWLNSQAHEVDAETLKKYPNHFSPAGMDMFAMADQDVERGEYWSMILVGEDLAKARAFVKGWLDGLGKK